MYDYIKKWVLTGGFKRGGRKQKGIEKIEVKRGKGVEKRTKPKKKSKKKSKKDEYCHDDEPSDGAWTVGDGVGSVREFARKDE